MKVYRYEKPDGGGPWSTLDGVWRSNNEQCKYADDYVYGCDSFENLEHYFTRQEFMKDGCQLKVYDVPKDEAVFIPRTHVVLFPKKFRFTK